MTSTHTLDVPGAVLTYDVHGPLPTEDGRPPLMMIGQPMDASGFGALSSHFPDRTVVTYDPRGLGRSTRSDDRNDNDPRAAGRGRPRHHRGARRRACGAVREQRRRGDGTRARRRPPRRRHDARRARAAVDRRAPGRRAGTRGTAGPTRRSINEKGWGAGMAAFIAMTSWQGEFTDEYARPAAARSGAVRHADRRRRLAGDPLLSDVSNAITDYHPDVDALHAAPTRVVIAVGVESQNIFTGRTAVATAAALGQAGRRLPQPPRRLHGRRVRLRRRAGGVRGEAARGPRATDVATRPRRLLEVTPSVICVKIESRRPQAPKEWSR